MKEIYLAGGCFWGTEKYFENMQGILTTEVGYANGTTKNPTYDDVCNSNSGHAETVKIEYDESFIRLPFLLKMYFEVVNPTSINRQGGDTGSQYRTGIYFTDDTDEIVIKQAIQELQKKYQEKIAIEVLSLLNYFKAEEYHQKYLDKHPDGYCHIGADKFENAKIAKDENIKDENPKYRKKTKDELKKELTKEQFEVTQNQGTESPFKNAYYDVFEEGIYVDITTGEPLFVSADKFESGCGWPSFSKPIDESKILKRHDGSYGRTRTEVRSNYGDTHLGHVFEDGPKEKGGLRYCINSASLEFVPKEEMGEKGYKDLLFLFY